MSQAADPLARQPVGWASTGRPVMVPPAALDKLADLSAPPRTKRARALAEITAKAESEHRAKGRWA